MLSSGDRVKRLFPHHWPPINVYSGRQLILAVNFKSTAVGVIGTDLIFKSTDSVLVTLNF